MNLKVFSAAVALAMWAFAAPTVQTTATNLVDIPAAYMMGFKNPLIQSSVGGLAICISGTVDLSVSANNFRINFQEPENQIAVSELITEVFQINSTASEQFVGGPNTVNGTFGIYSQLCFPNGNINATTVQFLIHGVGFDRSYWNLASNYSYVDYAASQGYTTFLYDRLGTGLSDHPDPIQIVQAELQVAIAHELIQLLRSGGIASQPFKHVVGVGHSFGSVQTVGITSQYPKDLDAAVLTGISATPDGQAISFAALDLTIASQAQPLRFSGLPNGYLTSSAIEGNQFFFFRAPGFDPALLHLAESTKQCLTIGELLTAFSIQAISTNFTGPIDVVNGQNDMPNCSGNCLVPHNTAAAVKDALYPAASNSSSYLLLPVVGHGVNFHYAAATAYEHIHNFIKTNGF